MAEKTFFVSTPANAPSAAGANKHHLTLWNGSAASRIKVYKITAIGAPTAAVTGMVISLVAQRIRTAAPVGGTAIVPQPAGSIAGDMDVLPSGIVAATGPTVVLANEEAVSFGLGTVSGEETAAGLVAVMYEHLSDWTKPVEIPAGQGMTIKQGALASAGAIHARILFTVV